jgi:hypothetical protein
MFLEESILKINPQAQFSINANDINQIVWLNETTPIPANEILSKQQELIKEYESKLYQRDRALSYPSIQDQLDMLYWDKVNGTNKWEETINLIKTKYPK